MTSLVIRQLHIAQHQSLWEGGSQQFIPIDAEVTHSLMTEPHLDVPQLIQPGTLSFSQTSDSHLDRARIDYCCCQLVCSKKKKKEAIYHNCLCHIKLQSFGRQQEAQ